MEKGWHLTKLGQFLSSSSLESRKNHLERSMVCSPFEKSSCYRPRELPRAFYVQERLLSFNFSIVWIQKCRNPRDLTPLNSIRFFTIGMK